MSGTNTPKDASKALIPPHIFWPGLVCVIALISLSICTTTVVLATSDQTHSVEADYYEKAVRWDDTRAQWAKNERLGWSVRYTIGHDDDGRAYLRGALQDADGDALDGATVRCEIFHHTRMREAQTLSLIAKDRGVYRAQVQIDKPGLWEVRTRVELDGDVYTDEQTLVVGG